MSSDFKEYFPSLTTFFDDFFSAKENNSIQDVARTLINNCDFKKIHQLFSDISRFNTSDTSLPVKTKDLLLTVNYHTTEVAGLHQD